MILEVKNLGVSLNVKKGRFNILREIDMVLKQGETLALVGESGCGKTLTALSILRLLPPNLKIEKGEIFYKDINLLNLKEEDMRKIRGREIAMIFQEPSVALNPVFTIGEQVAEVLRVHQGLKKREAKERAIDLLKQVKIPDPHLRYKSYPHQLSGGMKQRVVIAMALAAEPEVLIADEPTTALDVTIQAQILDLLFQLKEERGLSLFFITHNLTLTKSFADTVAVMYFGQIVEYGKSDFLLKNPYHPYTKGLISSLPQDPFSPLRPIPGTVPDITSEIKGCPFYNRCSYKLPKCSFLLPPFFEIEDRKVRCWLYEDN
jgi:oligopeptide/dipeptide ABC transporter ATP-binding protein